MKVSGADLLRAGMPDKPTPSAPSVNLWEAASSQLRVSVLEERIRQQQLELKHLERRISAERRR